MGSSCRSSYSGSGESTREEEYWMAASDEEASLETQKSSLATSLEANCLPCDLETSPMVSKEMATRTTMMETARLPARGTGERINERTALLQGLNRDTNDGRVCDLESQHTEHCNQPQPTRNRIVSNIMKPAWALSHPKSWDLQIIKQELVVRPITLLPAVFLGLLLNMLDALSYGMILFPLSHSVFDSLGPDGISIFYISTLVAQITYSSGGSVFRGGTGSQMIEVVPFFHKMAFIILAKVGEANPGSVIATTALAYAFSSILTGAVFFLMGSLRLGALTAFFPQHVLMGCIGGVGWFLMLTAMKVSTSAHNDLSWEELFRGNTAPLWLVPLALAFGLVILQHFSKSGFLLGGYFAAITIVFYLVKFLAGIPMTTLRQHKWVFLVPPENGHSWYHFFTLYDFKETNWVALMSTTPTMLALAFFSVLHVPINIPALSTSIGEDNVNVDRELIAHGASNCLSGVFGCVQNYLVYSNSLLFIKSGGNDRLAGVMLAAATLVVLLTGLTVSVIGYIPVMIVGALIFLLGIELMSEALISTFGKLNLLEYITIIAVILATAIWDFTTGIILGIAIALLHSVISISQYSVIQATLPGDEIRSTTRSYPIQLKHLLEMRQKIRVLKLNGVLFFGTVPSVENHIRSLLEKNLLDSQSQSLKYLILDMVDVDRVDFSATRVLVRVSRILAKHKVQYIFSGLESNGKVGRVLRSGELSNCIPNVWFFETLDEAMESCENRLSLAS